MLSFMEPIDSVLSTKAHQPLVDYLTAQTPFRYRAIFSSESERNVGFLEERLVEISHLRVVSYLEAESSPFLVETLHGSRLSDLLLRYG